ncbi:NAD(P)H-binding protein [Vibrio ostreicida]|uniref:NAD(P)H-binding protein n=1 Tax=Vibrio ostreicida TaxID=526588 RepID=UPI000970EEAD|nr:NAD(P)H-binding protein [Vibrio ostreicida]
MKTITIVGGGWLGKPLAHYLVSIGHQVFVSRTSQQGAQALNDAQLNGLQIDLRESVEKITQSLRCTATEIVIGCFPPGFRQGNGEEYPLHWKKLSLACQAAGVDKLVMVSSTTVYPSIAQAMQEGDASLMAAQHSSQFSANATIMLEAEQHIINSGLNYGVVRCSGLVGPERHPARFVSKLKQVSQSAPANMLHLTDAIGATSFIALSTHNVIVNATTPNTVSKAEFYQAALESVSSEESLPPIVDSADKRIVSDFLMSLGYRFHYQHTLELF